MPRASIAAPNFSAPAPVRKKRKTDVSKIEATRNENSDKYDYRLAVASQRSLDRPLTELQKAFVRLWAQGESINSAAYKAGYKDAAAAYITARMPSAIALYEAEKKAYEEAAQMTRKRVMDGLLEAAEMAKLMAEPASMVSAWREIGKMCGYYEPVKLKLDVTTNGQRNRMERMTDEELEKLVGAPIPAEVLGVMNDEQG